MMFNETPIRQAENEETHCIVYNVYEYVNYICIYMYMRVNVYMEMYKKMCVKKYSG